MKIRSILGFITFCILSISNNAIAALLVTPSNDPATLATTILGNGITNITNLTYTGGSMQSGLFSGGSSAGLGFETGILLTTGLASNAVGPNTTGFTSEGGTIPGDDDLDLLAGGDNTTFNAAILQFDFESTGGDLFFNYVFASEEYPGPNGDAGFVNENFNDVFAFFLDGVNIATIPGTSSPIVSVDNINSNTNSQFFKDNSSGAFNIAYDGFTVVLTAMMTNLDPTRSHTIRLAIADAGDELIDSAVFIQGGSFSDTPMPIPVPAALPLFLSALLGICLVGRSSTKKFQ